MTNEPPVLHALDLWKSYPRKQSFLARLREGADRELFHAVQALEFKLFAHQCLGVVGESGSGKTTLSRMIAGLLPPSRGRMLLDGKPIAEAGGAGRSRVQMASSS